MPRVSSRAASRPLAPPTPAGQDNAMTLTRDQARRLAFLDGAARCALGAVALILPALPLAPWVGDARHDRSARLLARALGGRDLALGLGTLLALRDGTPIRGWLQAG